LLFDFFKLGPLVAQLKQDNIAFDSRGEALDAARHAWATHTSSGFEAQLPGVQGAHDYCPRHYAIGQRTASVRTPVINSKEAVTKVKDGDLALTNFHRAAFAHWYVAAVRDANPRFRAAHAKTSSRGLICTN
jgi:hypothetical protein